VTTFSGIPLAAVEFYEQLAVNNSKTWWAEHKDVYEQSVRLPLEALLAELEGEFGAAHIYRPYRDVRFSKEKTPYKDHQGALIGVEDSIGYYVQISAEGLYVGGGWYAASSLQTQRYRDAIDSAAVGALTPALAKALKAGLALSDDLMKTRPRGIADDHPHLELLRRKNVLLSHQFGTPSWLDTRTTLTKVRSTWRALTPIVEWLADHVGPADSGIPAEPE
jgi:uncharacterized protein (TIGR02453 family)